MSNYASVFAVECFYFIASAYLFVTLDPHETHTQALSTSVYFSFSLNQGHFYKFPFIKDTSMNTLTVFMKTLYWQLKDKCVYGAEDTGKYEVQS